MSETEFPHASAAPCPSDLQTSIFTAVPTQNPVEILLDPWGIPHIYAVNARDGYIAQGFNAARERLWQIDLWRRRGLGILSEVFGRSFVKYDRAARLFLYRGSIEEEWDAYGDGTREAIEAFVEGVNAFVAQTCRDERLLAPEFQAIGYQPARWSAADVVRIRWHGRFRNLRREVARARMVRDFGLGAERLRMLIEPDIDLTVPGGLDLQLIDDSVLGDYELATGPLDLSALGIQAVGQLTGPEGSNAWVVSPHRTATGRPLLAGDPHRALQVPAVRYAVHVESPELSFIGAGEPQLPGVSMGHNGHIAFGMTVLPLDQEDLYVYELDVGGKRYRYRDGWEPVRIERTVIPVRGGETVEEELLFTRHGPIVHHSADGMTAFAVRAAWLEPGMAPYAASISMLDARSWDQFRAASRRWRAPGSNLVYADTAGHIGWQPRIGVPIRPNWSGLFPVPGDGRYEWREMLNPDSLPYEYDPPRGWIATANELNLDEQLLRVGNLGFEFEPAFRYERIAEVLGHGPVADVQSMLELQTDCTSMAARQLLPLTAYITGEDPDLGTALSLFSSWDGRLSATSPAAALFEVWLRRFLRPALIDRELSILDPGHDPALTLAYLLELSEAAGDARTGLALLARAVAEDRPALLELLRQTLAAALADLRNVLGRDPGKWSWGQLHYVALSHPIEPLLDEDLRKLAAFPASPRSGSVDTVGSTGFSHGSYAQDWGASWRMIIDVGAWDESLAINTPGQSGDPRSGHYADLLSTWAADGAVPLLFTRARIAQVAAERILLTPDGQ